MTDKPVRGWFSFRLWQLFAVMTVIGCYLAWQIYIVKERKAELAKLKDSWTFRVTTVDQWLGSDTSGRVASVPIVRRVLLGDVAVQSISYYPHMALDPELKRLQRIFPEANLVQDRPPLEPCHPGCFPHGTLVSTPGGLQKIESIAVGDRVCSISLTGDKKSLAVQSIFRTQNRLWEVQTDRGLLVTTETQPLCTLLDKHIPAGELQPGDALLVWDDNEPIGNQLQEVRVVSVRKTDQIVPVINLVLGNREPFIANGYLARSKPPKASSEFRVQSFELDTKPEDAKLRTKKLETRNLQLGT